MAWPEAGCSRILCQRRGEYRLADSELSELYPSFLLTLPGGGMSLSASPKGTLLYD